MKKKGIILLLSLGLAGLCALFMANTAPNEAERLSESCRHEYIDQKIEPTCTEKGYRDNILVRVSPWHGIVLYFCDFRGH